MDVEKAIRERRSIRSFKDKEISDDLINKILEAGRLAPSAHNVQPWRYLVIKDKETKEMLEKEKAFVQPFVHKSPVLIVCLADLNGHNIKENHFKEAEDNIIWTINDLGISTAYMTLQAQELGLSTCYVGLIKRERIRELLGLDKALVLPYVIALGYPNESPDPRPRKPLKEITLHK
jgi:nitroreductase